MAKPEAYLVIGPSGSGKTSYVNLVLRKISKKRQVVIAHGGEDAEEEYKEFNPRRLSLEECKKVSNCSIIIDDFVKTADRESKQLLRILGYCKRHNNSCIFVNTYQLYSTGASGLVAVFDKVVFTRHPSNWRSLRIFRRLYPMDVLTEARMKSFFAGSSRYLVADLKRQEIKTLGDDATSATEDESPQKEVFSQNKSHLEALLANFADPDLLTAVLAFIERNIDLDDLVDPRDFSISLRTPRSKKTVKVSLVDFLVSVGSDQKPRDEIVSLYNFFALKFHIPFALIQNPHLRR